MRYGYSFVSEKAYVGFSHDLKQGRWGDVPIKKLDTEDRKPKGLLEAPRPVAWKLRATWSIADVLAALAIPDAEAIAKLDTEWDSSERALNHGIAAAEDDQDAAKQAAASRLRATLLLGQGTEQTKLGWDAEVDFGRQQALLTADGPLAADVKLLGLGPAMKRIQDATEALARGVGRGPGETRAPARSRRIRDATTACSTTFNVIHEELAWHIEHTPEGDDRTLLLELQKPFLALLERNPPPAGAPKEGPADDAEPAPEG